MPAAIQLLAFGLRQVIDVTPDVVENAAGLAVDVAASAGTAGKVFALVRQRLTDHGETLPKALTAANDRAWQAVAVALAGRGFFTSVKEFFTGRTPKALHEQVEAFLAQNADGFPGTSESFRRECLRELRQADKAGLLAAGPPDPDGWARQAAAYRGLADPQGRVAEAHQAVAAVAGALPRDYPNLTRLLKEATPPGQAPLLVAAFSFFFRRQVETNDELHRGLSFAGLYQEATESYAGAAAQAEDRAARAANHYKMYLTALEQRRWDEGLAALTAAADLDAPHYAPFPLRQYEPRRILGAGGFGTAFLCRHRILNYDVVIKSLYQADLEQGLDKVFAEVHILRLLSREHPSIIGVQDGNFADDAQTRPYIVMDYFPGVSLQAHLEQLGPKAALPLEDFLPIARQIVEAMLAAHGRDVLHRDLKPDNVLVLKEDGRWQVKVIDFGLAVRTRTAQVSTSRPAQERTLYGDSAAGTAEYASPEQMGKMPGIKPGTYSDVYTFGKLCCYALFRDTEPKRRQWASLPPELADMLERCVEKDLEHRHRNFEPVLAVLKALDPVKTETSPEPDLTPLRQEGEAKLARLVRDAYDRTRGKPTEEDNRAAAEVCRQHQLTQERAKAIAREVREQWQKEQLREPRPGEVVSNSLGMKFAWIPPGTFLMGSPKTEEGREFYQGADETQHRVALTKGFHLGVHQVARGQFGRFVKAAGYKTEAERDGGAYYWTGKEWKLDPNKNWRTPGFNQADDHPVVCVSWNDAVAFCDWLTKQDGQGRRYRLPTEAEWEYACRAGTTTSFHFGDTISSDQANYDGNYTYGGGKKGVYRKQTTSVASFPPNAWGLCDMHGNVFEWCQDWFGPYPKVAITDQIGPEKGEWRVLRGGFWGADPVRCRAAFRRGNAPSSRFDYFGCRVAFCLDWAGGSA